jgi:hypothetical protein
VFFGIEVHQRESENDASDHDSGERRYRRERWNRRPSEFEIDPPTHEQREQKMNASDCREGVDISICFSGRRLVSRERWMPLKASLARPVLSAKASPRRIHIP